jgi:peptidase M28-like protein
VPATGRIVWAGGGWGRPRYGVEWTHQGPQRSWIGWLADARLSGGVPQPRGGRADVDARVRDLLQAIRTSCEEAEGESYVAANERHVEDFVAVLRTELGGRCLEVTRGAAPVRWSEDDRRRWEDARRCGRPTVVVERQRLSRRAVRTTRCNYLFTVPGETEDRVVLVAHYDTWGGPGADDNTTGEEILKQYLLADLRAERRPALTRTYFLAASEECGAVGLGSQVLLSLGLVAANLALSQRSWWYAAAAVALSPLAGYRFGVTGSREYVRTLTEPELARIRAAIAVDSVGEGRLYIPRATLGADFVRAVIPFGDYGSLDDLLEEAAHVHGVKYNSYLAGGTTDHLSFLEVHNGLLARAGEAAAGAVARLRGRRHAPPLRVPAAAIVAMGPGKASPLVFGGKLHTRRDVPEHLDPRPLRETLLILDYVLDRLDGGARPREPRHLDEYHYARLYRGDDGHYVVLKDAIEPNRRNLNGVYRATARVEGRRASAGVHECVGWGVEALFGSAPRLGLWFFDHLLLTLPLVMILQVATVLLLISRWVPTWIDNAYRHENGADNLGSLRRVPRGPAPT